MYNRVLKGNNRLKKASPGLCVERAKLLTDAYKKYENYPIPMLRAKSLGHILREMSIFIYEDELIVGNQTSKLKSPPIFPEFSIGWIEDEIDELHLREVGKYFVEDEDKETIKNEIIPFWKGKSVFDKCAATIPKDIFKCHEELIFLLTGIGSGVGHVVIDYKKLLEKGMGNIKKEAEELKGALSGDEQDPTKAVFYDSIICICDEIINFAHRYAALAEQQANKESNETRKKELLEIARICKKVPEYPADTFYEALQSFWFIQLAIQLESNGHSISPGRFDQYMYPYYKKDLEEGIITNEEIEELMQCLWIKFNEIAKIRDKRGTKAFGGNPVFQNLIVGGIDSYGKDCSNELSELCIKTSMVIKMPQPSLSLRYHSKTPEKLLQLACELSKLGQGMPAYFNDEVIIPIMMDLGASLVEARDYAEVGCVEPQVSGKAEGMYTGGFLNLLKPLELLLYNGVNPVTGTKILSGHENSMENIDSYDELYEKYASLMSKLTKYQGEADNVIDYYMGVLTPTPLVSCFVHDCLKEGKDVRCGGAKYNYISPNAVGTANAADSLAVIKKKVFEEKKYSLSQLKGFLDANYEGYEDVRQEFINDVPKYGNDEPYVDEIAQKVAADYCDSVRSIKTPRGGCHNPGLQSISSHILFMDTIGASPDGRTKEMLLSDGGVSAAQGRDKHGVTALMNSVSKLDHERASNGSLLNVKFSPQTVSGETGTKNMSSIIRSFFEMKGQHVQFNIVNVDTLKAAQKNPEEYQDLIVRVAGFSVYFAEIDSSLQNDIIQRTEQRF